MNDHRQEQAHWLFWSDSGSSGKTTMLSNLPGLPFCLDPAAPALTEHYASMGPTNLGRNIDLHEKP